MDNPELSLVEKQRRALSLGREFLDVENGHIQRRNDGEATDKVVVTVGENPDVFPEGKTLDRGTTYCRRTVEEHSPVALSNASEQGWEDDPAYDEHGFDCYLGTTIFVAGEVYGTVCFVSRDARATDFTSEEEAFVELIARLLGREIEANTYEQRIVQTERAQQRSENKYESLLRLAPDAVFLADADTTRITEVNEQAVELTGYAESDLQGMSVVNLHPSEERDRYAELFDSDLGESPRDRFDDGTPLFLRHADGADIPIELSVRRVDIGDQTLVQGIVRDVSARREREEELKRKREFLQQTQEAADLGGWEVDLATDTLRWTDEVYRIHDLPLEYDPTMSEAIGFFHPEDQATISDAFDRLVTDGEPYDLEVRIVTADNAVRWVRAIGRPQYDDSEEIVAVRGVFQDITERKEREQNLHMKSQALDESTVGITIGHANRPDMPIVYANDGFTKLTGYSKQRVLGNNCRFLQGEDTDDETVAEIRSAIRSQEPIRTEVLNYRADGTPFWNRLTIAPVTRVNDDEVTHYVGIQEDITAKKRRDRLIGVLNRVLRHNLRNDMTAVMGFAGEIEGRTDGEVARLASRVKQTAADLVELSEKARGFQTAARDAEPLAPRDILSDVKSVVADLRTEYPDVDFSIDVGASAEVMATERLRLALKELGENAAKHGNSSAVTYQVEVTDDTDVAVHVRDTGPGLPDVEQHVLEAGQETPLEHGTGIGLWLVNWIVTGLGGDVIATVDDGTTVTVRFSTAADGAVPAYRDSAFSTQSE